MGETKKVRAKRSRTVTDFDEFAAHQFSQFGIRPERDSETAEFHWHTISSPFSFITVSTFDVGPYRAKCGIEALSRSGHPELYVIQVPKTETVSHTRDSRREDVGVGELAVLDTRLAGIMTIEKPTKGSLLVVPVKIWESIAPPPAAAGSFVIRNNGAVSRLACGFAREIAQIDTDIRVDHEPTIARQLIELLSLALTGEMGGTADRMKVEFRLRRIKAFILNRLADPSLSPRLIAEELGLSVRSVSKLFQAIDTSPMEFIWQRRLYRAAELLAMSNTTNGAIKEVWHLVGFRNPSHFSSMFRKLYGMTPSDFRSNGHHGE